VRVIQTAFGPQPFEYNGEFVQIPKRYMVPLPVQRPFPPMSVAATSPDSMALAAENGLAVMTGSYFFGWPWLETLAKEYFKAKEGAPGTDPSAESGLSVLAYTYCAETDEQARREGFESLYNAARLGSLAFTRLAEMSKSYGYMAQAADIADRLTDPGWLIEESGSVICGSPETCATQIARYIEMGASEVIIRIDGPEHHQVMRSLELIGKYVLPRFTSGYAYPPEGLVAGGIT
jgi:alkanesulfonate monooxygenase SsuD/methylene tetrahydromethanopterin reductase-like flavin-dependent oxidoreductase (luciferase family)